MQRVHPQFVLTTWRIKSSFMIARYPAGDCTGKVFGSMTYHLLGEEGPDHNKSFKVSVFIGKKE